MKHTLEGKRITATINEEGAELCSLQRGGLELLWQAGPAWPRHAPILFPIVGKLKDDQLHCRDRTFPMMQHGFARDRNFQWRERSSRSCTLVLVDDAETHIHFPYAFQLAVTYAVQDTRLNTTFEITNTGSEVLPVSLGGHPAFNWPLLPELPKEAYELKFSHDELAPLRVLRDGLLRDEPKPTPVHGKVLRLSEELFADGVIILDRLASHTIRYGAEQGPSISLSWQGFKQLGIWSKPEGASFVCIEPWYGFSSPFNFEGDFLEKPGILKVAPNETQALSFCIDVTEEPC